jgi:predicted transcriptional regulator of viral defense system
MTFETLLRAVGNLPLVEVESLLAGISDSRPLLVQLSRWCKAGKLIQIKRGLYLLSEEYRKRSLFEPYLAATIRKPSYISLEKALEYHGLIPEAVPTYTCVTTKRPGIINSGAGNYSYRHVKQGLFWGYQSLTVDGQTGFMALPEKALLDLTYFRGMRLGVGWLRELRLQHTEDISGDRLIDFAKKYSIPGMMEAVRQLIEFLESLREGEKKL